ncbi:uncharacterized protein CEXT_67011 [Caerostris extrusa]|uniref:Uncharacterized protein n=1 Tax=Caerostris extrusa TaxID=172846 RepID=A0AAV4P156_CAEEX|nr:uncharacterized protein CEXT_67011 [Caerostris extrusa]
MSQHYFLPFPLHIPVSRNVPEFLYESFNFGITRLVDADITGRTFKATLEVSNLCTSYSDTELKAMGLKNIHGVLLMWLAGVLTAILVLTCEIISKKFDI